MDSVSAVFSDYQPGLFAQDLITLPIEASFVFFATEYLPTTNPPLWPFTSEKNTEVRHTTRASASVVAPIAGAMVLPIGATVVTQKPSSFAFAHARGLAHTVLLTELGTVGAKRLVGRHRPSYDTSLAESGSVAKDDSYSFWSGHAAHSFAFSSYLCRLTFDLTSKPVAWGSAVVYYAVASWISASRVVDNAHHVSDVLVGAAVGSSLSWWVYDKVSLVASPEANQSAKREASLQSSWSFSPVAVGDGIGIGFHADL